MANIRRNLFSATVIGLLAILAWWSFDEKRPAPERAEEPQAAYYFRDFDLHVTHPDGSTDYDLRGKRMTHFQQTRISLIHEPVWTVYMTTGAPWYGRSDNGRVSQGGDEVQLLGHVRLHRPPTAANPALTLEAPRLHLRPHEDYADTDTPVTLYGRDFRINAVGARAWMRQQRVQLLAKVEGHYEVSSH